MVDLSVGWLCKSRGLVMRMGLKWTGKTPVFEVFGRGRVRTTDRGPDDTSINASASILIPHPLSCNHGSLYETGGSQKTPILSAANHRSHHGYIDSLGRKPSSCVIIVIPRYDWPSGWPAPAFNRTRAPLFLSQHTPTNPGNRQVESMANGRMF